MTADSERIDAHVWRVSAVVLVGSVMSILDTTIVNVALATLGRELHSTIAQIQWVVTGYMLALAAVIPVTGWAARRSGAKRVYLLSLVLFPAGSVLCGLATTTTQLIVFRVLQCVGGGMILPIGQMMMADAAGPKRMGRVMSIVAVPAMLAPILGPTIGGLIVDNASWRWIFFVNLPVGVIGATGSFTAPKAIVPLISGLVLIGVFALHALRVPKPLLDIRLYRRPTFASASVAMFCLAGALFGGMILMPLYWQQIRGESVVTTG